MKKIYRMKNLDCAHCAAKMETAIRRLDGGVITNNLLVSLLGPIQGIRIGGILSRICTVGLWMCAAAVQIRCGGNLSLFFISVCLLTKIAGG